ncbi:MAG TPA: RHS repeat-associated core domain-containing protein, partial [Ktedonobacteraceae bacterium]|nr:RHS repeat-associated core domain-containing protein [Ktedonobacteraceae bacterium]
LSYTDAGGTVNYGYNAVNLLATITDPNGAKTTYTYDADVDSQTSTVYPNGVTVSYTYDGDRHVTSIVAKNSSGTKLTSFNYTYDGDLVDTVTDLSNNKTSYDYDALNRLREVTTFNSSGTQTGQTVYNLDGAGNRLSLKVNGTVQTSYTYNAANELTTTSQGGTTSTYTYDSDGNLTSGAGLVYTYNAANQTTSIGANTYTYTGSDQTQRVGVNGTTFTYSSLGLSATGSGGSGTYYTRDNKGKLISERTATGTYYYLLDHIGSVVGLTDSSGSLKNTYSYDAFGKSLGKSESVANPWQFASGYLDSSTNLYKFGTRYYSPQLGRWTQQDPAGGKLTDPNSLNPYVYAADDPVNRVDMDGRCSQALVIGLVLALAAAFIFFILAMIAFAPLFLGAATFGAALLSLVSTTAGWAVIGTFIGIWAADFQLADCFIPQ